MSTINEFLIKFNDLYEKGSYTKLEVFAKFIDFMTENKNYESFIKELKSFSDDWYLSFLLWFKKSYPLDMSFDNLVNFGRNNYDLSAFKKSIKEIRELIENEGLH